MSADDHGTQIGKIRTWLIQSGYPFENDVAEILTEQLAGFEIARGYPFVAVDADGRRHSRSVDFLATRRWDHETIPSKYWGQTGRVFLHFLVDAKRHADHRLVFLTISDQTVSDLQFPSIVPEFEEDIGYNKTKQVYAVEIDDLTRSNLNLPIATQGTIVNNTKGSERVTVDGMQIQLFGAVKNLLSSYAPAMMENRSGQRRYSDAHVVVPIVVTSNPMLFVSEGVTSKDIAETGDHDPLWKEVSAIAVQPPNLFHVKGELSTLWNDILRCTGEHVHWRIPKVPMLTPTIFCAIGGLPKLLDGINQRFETLGRH